MQKIAAVAALLTAGAYMNVVMDYFSRKHSIGLSEVFLIFGFFPVFILCIVGAIAFVQELEKYAIKSIR